MKVRSLLIWLCLSKIFIYLFLKILFFSYAYVTGIVGMIVVFIYLLLKMLFLIMLMWQGLYT